MTKRRLAGVSVERWGIPERDKEGRVVCRWCRGPVRWPRRTFCGDACVHEWRVRSDPSFVREQVWRRDGGICQGCRLDVARAERRWKRQRPPAARRVARRRWQQERPRWEADHIVPVADGGGACGLENYRLLCRACHVEVTRAWRRARAMLQSRQEVACQPDPSASASPDAAPASSCSP